MILQQLCVVWPLHKLARTQVCMEHGLGQFMLTVCSELCLIHARVCCMAVQGLQAGGALAPAHWLGRQKSHIPASAGICASSTAACIGQQG